MTRYLRPDLLERRRHRDLRPWAATFAQTVTELEVPRRRRPASR